MASMKKTGFSPAVPLSFNTQWPKREGEQVAVRLRGQFTRDVNTQVLRLLSGPLTMSYDQYRMLKIFQNQNLAYAPEVKIPRYQLSAPVLSQIDQIRAELQRWQQRGVVTRIGHLALRTTASGTELVADIYITDEAWANDVDLELREAIVTLLTDNQDIDLDINPSSRDSAQQRAG